MQNATDSELVHHLPEVDSIPEIFEHEGWKSVCHNTVRYPLTHTQIGKIYS